MFILILPIHRQLSQVEWSPFRNRAFPGRTGGTGLRQIRQI